jgi:predicted nucleic acid-binding protein
VNKLTVHNIHRGAYAAHGRGCLESFGSGGQPNRVHDLGLGSSSCAREVRPIRRREEAGVSVSSRDMGPSRRPAQHRNLHSETSQGLAETESVALTSVLFDSDVLIEHLRGRNSQISEQIDALINKSAPLFCSPVSIAELLAGARPKEEAALGKLFSVLTCLPIDAAIAVQAGAYLRTYGKSHSVEVADAFIGATAQIHGLRLWTRNRKHYPMQLDFFPE